jgi:hypothetical protein
MSARRPRQVHGPRLDVSWMDRAACVDAPGLPWLAEPDETFLDERLAMTATCAGCRVLSECADYLERAGVVGGFWAGQHRGVPRDPIQTRLFDAAS